MARPYHRMARTWQIYEVFLEDSLWYLVLGALGAGIKFNIRLATLASSQMAPALTASIAVTKAGRETPSRQYPLAPALSAANANPAGSIAV